MLTLLLRRCAPFVRKYCSSHQSVTKIDYDAMDNFTTQIIQKAVDKWDNRKRANLTSGSTNTTTIASKSPLQSCENFDTQQLATMFQDAIDLFDGAQLGTLIEKCLATGSRPPFSLLIQTLAVCSQVGDKASIVGCRGLCDSDQLSANSNFDHFVAGAVWVKGDVPKSLDLFDRVYRDNPFLRRRVRLMLQFLILDSVSRSEAVLWNIKAFCDKLVVDFKDHFPLSCLWQSCFLSEWFSDNCLALQLLDENTHLCRSIVNRIPYVVHVSLKAHRTEVVYRLLEVLLKYEMRQDYAVVLVALLDYQFHSGDFFSCSEIIRWAVENEVELPPSHQVKFINMILNQKMNTPFAPLKPKHNSKGFKLKF